MAETLFGGVGEIDFHNRVNMENIIIKVAGAYVSGAAFYFDQNNTFNLKGTEYCSIDDIVIFNLLIAFKVWKSSLFDRCRYRPFINF